MKTQVRTRLVFAAALFLGIAIVLAMGSSLFAEEPADSSSECIKCHTDLEKMDRYGAASAGKAAAIAG
jgi:hypothetical protein